MMSFSALWFSLLVFFSGADLCFQEHETIEYRALGGRLFEMEICGDEYVSDAFGHTDVPEHLEDIVKQYKQKQQSND